MEDNYVLIIYPGLALYKATCTHLFKVKLNWEREGEVTISIFQVRKIKVQRECNLSEVSKLLNGRKDI